MLSISLFNTRPAWISLMTASAALLLCTSVQADEEMVKRGEYLTRAADCLACHTANKSKPYAGGVPFETPFGTIYSTNITPDAVNGIGGLSEADFIGAVREGVSANGKRLYPAMPYPSYTQLSDVDIKAIRAYMLTVKPVAQSTPSNQLSFPFNQRSLMVAWNLFNFDSGRYVSNPGKSDAWNRGAYLANALGHCGECHTPRNFTQGSSNKTFAGGQAGQWQAYNITSDPLAGIGGWSDEELIRYIGTGATAGKASASGPMAEVIENSTRYLPHEELKALVTYLRDIPARNDGETRARFTFGNPIESVGNIRGKAVGQPVDPTLAGAQLYSGNCASCHGWQGSGVGANAPGAHPSLMQHSAVGATNPANLAMVILHGVHRETDGTHTLMPGFADQLKDAEITTLVNFITRQFGNPQTTIDEQAVAKMR